MLRKSLYCLVLVCTLLLAFTTSGMARTFTDADLPELDATGVEYPRYLNSQRIVSLAPNVTEMVCYLGFGPRLVGCSSFCDHPADVVADLPRVGGFVDTSLEAIVALDPDLVIAYQGNSRELVDQLRELEITVVAFNEAISLDEVGRQMYILGRVITPQVAELPPACQTSLDWANQCPVPVSDATDTPVVFFGYPGEMSYTCGPGTFLSDLINCAGCRNAVTDTAERWPMVGAEFIIAADPDVILTATSCTADEDPAEVRAGMLKTLKADPVWSELAAVSEGRIIVIDSDILMRPGPRLFDALLEIDAQLKQLGFPGIQGEATPE